MVLGRRGFLGTLGLIVPAAGLAVAAPVEVSARSVRPENEDWIAKDPVGVWAVAAFCPKDLLGPIMHIMGRPGYGLKAHQANKRYDMAYTAQVVLLRQMGNTVLRNGKAGGRKPSGYDPEVRPTDLTEDETFLWDFFQPSDERKAKSLDWLWNAYNTLAKPLSQI